MIQNPTVEQQPHSSGDVVLKTVHGDESQHEPLGNPLTLTSLASTRLASARLAPPVGSPTLVSS